MKYYGKFLGLTLAGPLVGLALVATPFAAASAAEEDGKQRPTKRGDLVESYDADGVPFNGFKIFPKLVIEEAFNSNIFKDSADEVDDFVTEISPSVNVNSDWTRHMLSFYAGGDFGIYADSSDDDYVDYNVGAEGRFDASRALTLQGGVRHEMLHEERGGDDVGVDAAEPVEYDKTSFAGDVKYQPNRASFTVGGSVDLYDYEDNPVLGSVDANNDDRDRTKLEGFVRFGYEVQEGYEAFIVGSVNDIDYDDNVDDAGQNRDSDGYEIQAGVAVDLSRLIRANASVGYLDQTFSDPTLSDANGVAADLDLIWAVTPLINVRATAGRSVEETTTANVSSTLVSRIGFGADYQFRRNIELVADFTASNTEYQGDPDNRDDDKIGIIGSVNWKINKYLFSRASYQFETRDSNISTEDYDLHVAMVNLGLQF